MKHKLITDEFLKNKITTIPCAFGTPNEPITIFSTGNIDIIRVNTNVTALGNAAYTLCDVLPHSYYPMLGSVSLMVAGACVGTASLVTEGNRLILTTTGYGAAVTIVGTVLAIRQ